MLRYILYPLILLSANSGFSDAKSKSKDDTKNPIRVQLSTKGNDIAFDQVAIQIPMAETISMSFSNQAAKGSEILHNVAVLKPGTLDSFLKDLQENGYSIEKVKGHPAVLAMTAALSPGAMETLSFQPPSPGFYPYVCVMAGHADMLGMKGILNVTGPKQGK